MNRKYQLIPITSCNVSGQLGREGLYLGVFEGGHVEASSMGFCFDFLCIVLQLSMRFEITFLIKTTKLKKRHLYILAPTTSWKMTG